MLLSFSELSHEWLAKCRIEIDFRYWKLHLESHPNYPSLLALTDTLDEIGLHYTVAKFVKDKLDGIPLPFMAHMADSRFEVVDRKLTRRWRKNFAEKTEFLEAWDGIVVIPDHPVDTKTSKQLQKINRSSLSRVSATLQYAIGALLTAVPVALSVTSHFPFFSLLLATVSIFGIAISALIIKKEAGEDNFLSSLVCGAGNDGCQAVLLSRGNQVFGIHLSEGAKFLRPFSAAVLASSLNDTNSH